MNGYSLYYCFNILYVWKIHVLKYFKIGFLHLIGLSLKVDFRKFYF